MEANDVTIDTPVMTRDEALAELSEVERWLNTFNIMQQQQPMKLMRQVRLSGYIEGIDNAPKLQTINIVPELVEVVSPPEENGSNDLPDAI